MIELLCRPDSTFEKTFNQSRDAILDQSLQDALLSLQKKLGPDWSAWQYGQEKMKHVLIKHPLSLVVNENLKKQLNVGPAPRGGNANTVNSTGGNLNQSHGASFRIIVDCSDWDLTLATNSPGQSGDPGSLHYRDLFELWSRNQYFPLYFSREKIISSYGK